MPSPVAARRAVARRPRAVGRHQQQQPLAGFGEAPDLVEEHLLDAVAEHEVRGQRHGAAQLGHGQAGREGQQGERIAPGFLRQPPDDLRAESIAADAR